MANQKAAKAAKTPAQKVEEQKLTFATLEALKPADLAVHAQAIPSLNAAIDKAREKFTGCLKPAAKIVAAMKRQYITRLNGREIPPDTDFKDYFEANAKGKLPGRVEALAVLFNTLVLTNGADGKPMLSEENFDAAKVDWLEKANAIVSAARKIHGDDWKMSDDVLDTINALSKPGDAAKTLKEIRERQKSGGSEATEDENAETGELVPMTAGRAVEYLKAAIENAAQLAPDEQRALFLSTLEVNDTWGRSYVSDDLLDKWSAEYNTALSAGAAPHLEIVKAA